MMTFEEFCQRVQNEAQDRYPDNGILLQKVKKNNDVELTGLVILNPQKETSMSPTIYLDGYYQEYMHARPFSSIMRDVLGIYERHKDTPGFNLDNILNYELAAPKLRARMVSYELNRERLQDIPHVREGDFAIICHVDVKRDLNEGATVTVNGELLKQWNVSFDEVYERAQSNMAQEESYSFRSVEEILPDMGSTDGFGMPFLEEMKMYVLTNKEKSYGAIEILNPSVQDKIAEVFGNRYCVLPSSVHEVIILPYIGDVAHHSIEELESMIKEVNQEQLSEDEILSDKAYMVDAEKHVFMRLEEALAKEQKEQMEKDRQQEEKRKAAVPKKEVKPRGPKL